MKGNKILKTVNKVKQTHWEGHMRKSNASEKKKGKFGTGVNT